MRKSSCSVDIVVSLNLVLLHNENNKESDRERRGGGGGGGGRAAATSESREHSGGHGFTALAGAGPAGNGDHHFAGVHCQT